MDLLEAIRDRRTHKQFTGEPVSRQALETLLSLAVWAPNHRMTEPWRFHVVPHERIPALVEAVLAAITPDAPRKLIEKRPALAERLARLGAFISVARMPAGDPQIDREDYAACCCAVHNMLLAAHGMGLGSYWSTGAAFELPAVRAFLRLPEGLLRVASIWLGVPAGPATSRRRPAAELTTWI